MSLIHKSWLELKPNENEDGNQEWFDEYYKRIKLKKEFKNIPKEVFEQWIHAHHKNYETLNNYAWIDYEKVEFKLLKWSFEKLENINIIENYREYSDSRAICNDLSQFCCCDKDLKHWKENGTWRIPPIILDVKSIIDDIPKWSEIKEPFQLVEGHSRIGYLKSMNRINKLGKEKISDNHKIYLMTKVRMHNNV